MEGKGADNWYWGDYDIPTVGSAGAPGFYDNAFILLGCVDLERDLCALEGF